jgi:hypothetical protein
MSGEESIGILITPQENEMSNLSNSIVEWRRLKDQITESRMQVREWSKKMNALEEVILRIMKNNNIGALDLKTSGGRVIFRKQKRQGALGKKNMLKFMTEFMKSEEKAKEALNFIEESRETVIKESLLYQK